MYEVLPTNQPPEEGYKPEQHLEASPAPFGRILGTHEGEDIAKHWNLTLSAAVRNGVLGKHQEVAEDDKVGHEQPCIRVLQEVPAMQCAVVAM